MEALSVFDILRIGVGLSIFIMNLTATIVLFKCRRMAFQIRIFTAQLAIADALFGVLMVSVGLRIASVSLVACRINFHFNMMVHFMTSLTITAMSGDRYLALCFPLQYRSSISHKKVKFLSALLWIFAASLSIALLVGMTPGDFTGCDYIKVTGENGLKLAAALYITVIVLNASFYVGILWTLLHRMRIADPVSDDREERHIREQRTILMKILAIVGLFVCTYIPNLICIIIASFDFDNREKYTTFILVTAFLGFFNSVLSPFVYVWRYPECRYTFLIYCTFWSRERQEKLREKLDRSLGINTPRTSTHTRQCEVYELGVDEQAQSK